MTNDLEFFQWGNSAAQGEIGLSETKGLFAAVNEYPFAKFIEFRQADQKEAIVLELTVELPQSPPVPIHRTERIAVVFSGDPIVPPQFLALRKDFPETLHQNLVDKGSPKSLCLFEEAYYDVKSKLTSKLLLYRIGDWLARAAVGELHLSDQLIEPLLLTDSRIFFDPKLFGRNGALGRVFIIHCLRDKPLLLKAYELGKVPAAPNQKLFILLPIDFPPSYLRLIEYSPYNFEDLSAIFDKLNVNITKLMQDFLIQLTSGTDGKKYYKHEVVILIHLPKMRRENGPIESHEYWAFHISDTIENLAIKLGTHGKQEGQLGRVIGAFATSKLDEVLVMPLKPTFSLSKELAKLLSGVTLQDKQIVAIGAGALGSQAILNLAKQGFGVWHIIDHDYILPHNLSRHGLSSCFEGFNKAQALMLEINGLLNDSSIAQAYPVNVLRVSGNEEELAGLREIILKSDLVLDFSTSRAVTKLLTSMDVKQEKLCSFITSSGKHLVALLQGTHEQINLEDLNYQLSAVIIDKPELSGMYAANANVTYSGSCRDASVQLPQDTIGLFAGVISKFILANAASGEAKIMVWSLDDQILAIVPYSLPVSNVKEYIVNNWTLRISENVIVEMQKYRQAHLPNETGGVLVGGIDVSRNIIYVSKALSSPPDSIEWPNSYIRGVRGLKEEINIIHKTSGNELSYIGEWHSHPKGYGSNPSSTDLAAHRILAEQMRVDGMPSLMLIIADDEHPYVLLNKID